MLFFTRYFKRPVVAKSSPPPPKPNPLDSFELARKYEDEGGAAGLLGLNRGDCPYDFRTNSRAWNFWVYGNEIARGELETLRSGRIVIACSTSFSPSDWDKASIDAREALRKGIWKPRFVKLEDVE